ncbi:MAG TPA: hypothetical protein VGP07_09460 [Polyangia bacterium]
MRRAAPAIVLGLTACVIGVALPARAEAALPPPPPGPPVIASGPAISPPPSAFEVGIDGFGMGIAAGLAGGYLVARENGLHESDWRPLVAGMGIGALAGGAMGLTFGLVDNDSASQGRGYLIMREMGRGGQFGLLAGGIIGGLAALDTNHPENILFGAAIGTLVGTGAGLLVGSLERNPWAPVRTGPVAMQLSVAPCKTARGDLSWGPAVLGRF